MLNTFLLQTNLNEEYYLIKPSSYGEDDLDLPTSVEYVYKVYKPGFYRRAIPWY